MFSTTQIITYFVLPLTGFIAILLGIWFILYLNEQGRRAAKQWDEEQRVARRAARAARAAAATAPNHENGREGALAGAGNTGVSGSAAGEQHHMREFRPGGEEEGGASAQAATRAPDIKVHAPTTAGLAGNTAASGGMDMDVVGQQRPAGVELNGRKGGQGRRLGTTTTIVAGPPPVGWN